MKYIIAPKRVEVKGFSGTLSMCDPVCPPVQVCPRELFCPQDL